MSQPPQSPDQDPAPEAPTAPEGRTSPGWPAPGASWPAPSDWTVTTPASHPEWTAAPQWQQPAPAVAPPPAAAPSPHGRRALAGAALAGLAAGAVGATFLVTAVFAGTAEDIGRGMAQEFGPAISEGVRDGMVEAAEEEMSLYEDEFMSEDYGWYAGGPGGDVEQFPPVEPEDLGPDEVLDEYAQSCFAGEYQACDDLLYESPPLSAYEEYASTCGGRVKEYAVPACTELE
ncbi:hypothetical protein DQ244_03100 [Blastococcus sp. TBT05-19]|uniref:hypothetical protein n=1 Tax=Blastococcus sp. TBT05-19 TaxID=2250581 RepID=UPI000DEB6CB6|nr:hypothetical protein [Blastococcus sp. TBT05-19]RBY94330.1 hypothetical protein DQ244_03100 [Blastococcus sp. TBT05-19]